MLERNYIGDGLTVQNKVTFYSTLWVDVKRLQSSEIYKSSLNMLDNE